MKLRPGSIAAWVLLLSIGRPALGQGPGEGREHGSEPAEEAVPASRPDEPSRAGLPELVVTCAGADDFGGADLERSGWCLLQRGKYVSLRTVAAQALAESPSSFRAHYLMGAAQHLGEGNLPKALFHLEESEKLFVRRYGERPSTADSPWFVYRRALLELVYVHGEMDHHARKIEYVDALQTRLAFDYSPLKAWPLMKLKRWKEARAVARSAIEMYGSEDTYWRSIGLTALCAIESEMRNRQAAYEACRAAAEPVMDRPNQGGVALSNAAAAAMEMFRIDESERFYHEAARRPVEGTINPWGRLAHLYLRQGRFAEAVTALREMKRYRMRRPAYFDQQDQTDAELTGASVLMIAGRIKEAFRITRRAVDRPDRQGTSSASTDQSEAGNLIMDRVARLSVARSMEEEASFSSFWDGMELRLDAAKLRFEAWIEEQEASRVLADRDRLITTLRPECPGSIELPSWLDGEVISIVGPGVALAAIKEARREETLDPSLSEPIFSAFEAEAHLLQHNNREALDLASRVVDRLPAVEALLRARAAAMGALAARRLGEHDRARMLLGHVLAADPGVLRRLGHTLPVQILMTSESPQVRLAAEHLSGSPRFDVEPWGYRLLVGDEAVSLTLPDGSELVSAPVRKGHAGDVEQLARQIARTAHEDLLVPSVDITQSDIRSLDGGVTGGGRATERTKTLLDEILGP